MENRVHILNIQLQFKMEKLKFLVYSKIMAKQQPITIDGVIKETLPSAMFRVEIEIGEDKHEVLAHVRGKMRMHFIKILPGDIVTLEVSPYDISRGRIVYRKK